MQEKISLDKLEKSLALNFNNKKILEEAFTHGSYLNENRGQKRNNNERLEFLGDAVLELVVSEYIYQKYPKLEEGKMTKIRAALVCEPALVKYTELLGLAPYIMLGKGEEMVAGRERPALLADVFEAFVAAIYLDQGLDVVKSFLEKNILNQVKEDDFAQVKDHKSLLQELVQEKNLGELSYRVIGETGPAHDKTFISQVILGGEPKGQGRGKTKKEAEQMAAANSLEDLRSKKTK